MFKSYNGRRSQRFSDKKANLRIVWTLVHRVWSLDTMTWTNWRQWAKIVQDFIVELRSVKSGDKAKASMAQETIKNLLKKLLSYWKPSPSYVLLFPARTRKWSHGRQMRQMSSHFTITTTSWLSWNLEESHTKIITKYKYFNQESWEQRRWRKRWAEKAKKKTRKYKEI